MLEIDQVWLNKVGYSSCVASDLVQQSMENQLWNALSSAILPTGTQRKTLMAAARIIYNQGDVIPNTRLAYQHDLPSKNKRRQAAFICSCGNQIETDLHWVRFLNITSCGCYKTEVVVAKNTKHSHAVRNAQSGAYKSWQAMHQRVLVNPNYAHVTVCTRWSGDDGFANFYADMGDRAKGMTIERSDNTKGYEPSNCVWATSLQQAQNTSQTGHVVINGIDKSINEWCRQYGIGYHVVKQRRKRGISLIDAITTPLNPSKQGRKRNV